MSEDEKTDLEMGRLMRKLGGDPKTRKPLLNLVRAQNPAARFPELEVDDLRSQMKREREAQRAAMEAAIARSNMEAARTRVRQRYDEPQVKEIEALMTKHGISDYEVGAKLYAAETPPPQSESQHTTNSSGGMFSMPDDKGLLQDPRKWANDMAHNVINELRGQRK